MICEECGKKTADRKTIEQAIKEGKPPGINKHYDVPYMAGYSTDGGTIYIDRHFPLKMDFEGKSEDITPYIIEHEVDESRLIHKLGFDYLHAHHIAQGREAERVKKERGEKFLHAYQKHCKEYEKPIEHEELTKVPKNLDITPYKDEHAKELIQRLKDAMV